MGTKHLKAHSKKQHKRHDSWLGVVSTHDKKRVKHVATRVTVKKKAKRKLSKKKAEKKAEVQVLFLKDVAHQAVKKKDTKKHTKVKEAKKSSKKQKPVKGAIFSDILHGLMGN